MSLSLHPLFSDHAVLPRDVPLPVTGRSIPGQSIKVSIAGQQVTTRADMKGRWSAMLEPLNAGGPLTLTISTSVGQLIRRNLLVGEVWLASGQSNMEWPLRDSSDAAKAIAAARLPRVRLFKVSRRAALEPCAEPEGRWEECSSKTAGDFSAIGFHFARLLNEALDCPIGIIQAAWGGTMALPWTEAGFIRNVPELAPLAAPLDRVRRLVPEPPAVVHADTGNTGEAKGWSGNGVDDAALPELPVPGLWQRHGMPFNGAVWYRKRIEIPPSWAGRALRIDLGPIDDFDTTYFNGLEVGATGPKVADAWRTPRRYRVEAGRVHAGPAVVAVRVFDQGGEGGFGGPADLLKIYPEGSPGEAMPLAGPWRVVVERRIPLPAAPAFGSSEMTEHQFPSGLFNGMIAPLAGYPIRGVLWYQGESDVDRAHLYRTIFDRLILSWRAAWNRPDLPFLFVQLANHLDRHDEPADDAWAELREAQAMALRQPATGMAVAADLGDAVDIHPRDKRSVAERLLMVALSVAYGRTMPHSGPTYAGHAVEDGAVRVRFGNTTGGLRVRGNELLGGFEIAGADRRFCVAEARLDGTSVVLSHADVPAPIAVRYAWQANPPMQLENGLGLPAAPFRTDDWPGVTVGRF